MIDDINEFDADLDKFVNDMDYHFGLDQYDMKMLSRKIVEFCAERSENLNTKDKKLRFMLDIEKRRL